MVTITTELLDAIRRQASAEQELRRIGGAPSLNWLRDMTPDIMLALVETIQGLEEQLEECDATVIEYESRED